MRYGETSPSSALPFLIQLIEGCGSPVTMHLKFAVSPSNTLSSEGCCTNTGGEGVVTEEDNNVEFKCNTDLNTLNLYTV